MRKKLKDMTPFERVEPRLIGLSNEEAEDVAVQILAQILAKHIHVFKDGEDHLLNLMCKIVEAAGEYSKKHSFELAAGRVAEENRISSTN